MFGTGLTKVMCVYPAAEPCMVIHQQVKGPVRALHVFCTTNVGTDANVVLPDRAETVMLSIFRPTSPSLQLYTSCSDAVSVYQEYRLTESQRCNVLDNCLDHQRAVVQVSKPSCEMLGYAHILIVRSLCVHSRNQQRRLLYDTALLRQFGAPRSPHILQHTQLSREGKTRPRRHAHW